MQTTQYLRDGHRIIQLEDDGSRAEAETLSSINEAKRKSRRLQESLYTGTPITVKTKTGPKRVIPPLGLGIVRCVR